MYTKRVVVFLVSCVVCVLFGGCSVVLTIEPTELPNGVVGTSYSQSLTVDSESSLLWRVSSGALPGGLQLNESTGALSGIPTEEGAFTFTIAVSESAAIAGVGERTYSITIIPKLTLDATLTKVRVNQAYSDSFTVAGGVQSYSYNIIGLPAGLSFDSSIGVISGTPLTAQTIQLQVTVADSGDPQQSVTSTAYLVVQPPPVSIATADLDNGIVNTAYSATLTANDGTTPLTWQVGPAVGTLPQRLRLDTATGEISGTPTVAGESSFTITATDSDSPPTTDSKSYSITIISKLALDATLDTARVSEAYSDQLLVSGGVSPYFYEVTGLPAGISFDLSTGQISGTPQAAGTSTLKITVTDSGEPQQSVNRTGYLVVKPAPVTITTTMLFDGNVGEEYAGQVTATNGTTPYTWQLSSSTSTFPPGLQLNSTNGNITGTPTAAGTYNFTITVTDSDSPATTDSEELTIVIQG